MILLYDRFNDNFDRLTRFDIGDSIDLTAIESLILLYDRLIDNVDSFTRFLSGNKR